MGNQVKPNFVRLLPFLLSGFGVLLLSLSGCSNGALSGSNGKKANDTSIEKKGDNKTDTKNTIGGSIDTGGDTGDIKAGAGSDQKVSGKVGTKRRVAITEGGGVTVPLASSREWSSDHPEIASVNAEGEIVFVSPGVATIICKDTKSTDLQVLVTIHVTVTAGGAGGATSSGGGTDNTAGGANGNGTATAGGATTAGSTVTSSGTGAGTIDEADPNGNGITVDAGNPIAAKDPELGDDGFPAGGTTYTIPVCKHFSGVRTQEGSVVDAFHQIKVATCAANERVIGGYCQCHQGAAWVYGRHGANGWACSCNINPTMVAAYAACLQCVD